METIKNLPLIPYRQVIADRHVKWQEKHGRRMQFFEEWLAIYPREERVLWEKWGKVELMRKSPNEGEVNNAIIMRDSILNNFLGKYYATSNDVPGKIRRFLKTQDVPSLKEQRQRFGLDDRSEDIDRFPAGHVRLIANVMVRVFLNSGSRVMTIAEIWPLAEEIYELERIKHKGSLFSQVRENLQRYNPDSKLYKKEGGKNPVLFIHVGNGQYQLAERFKKKN